MQPLSKLDLRAAISQSHSLHLNSNGSVWFFLECNTELFFKKSHFDKLHPDLYGVLVQQINFSKSAVAPSDMYLARCLRAYCHWFTQKQHNEVVVYGTESFIQAITAMEENVRKPGEFCFSVTRYSVEMRECLPFVISCETTQRVRLSDTHLEAFSPGASERIAAGVCLGLTVDQLINYVFTQANAMSNIVLPVFIS